MSISGCFTPTSYCPIPNFASCPAVGHSFPRVSPSSLESDWVSSCNFGPNLLWRSSKEARWKQHSITHRFFEPSRCLHLHHGRTLLDSTPRRRHVLSCLFPTLPVVPVAACLPCPPSCSRQLQLQTTEYAYSGSCSSADIKTPRSRLVPWTLSHCPRPLLPMGHPRCPTHVLW